MAGDDQTTRLAEALAQASGRSRVMESVAETLGRFSTWNPAGTTDQMGGLASQIEQLRQASEQQASVVAANTMAIARSTNAQGNPTVAGTLKPSSILSSIFGSGFGISPLVSGIMKLFGGGDETTTTTAPAEYERPQALSFTGGYARASGGRIYALDYAAGDRLRLMREAATDGTNSLDQSLPPATGGSSASAPTAQPPSGAATHITVQVQAMDSRSFLDHSEDIARAVRQAMLNSNGINDVITEL
ncbi:MAG: hypothetical protein LLG20_01045 [Acidobacteriales bacterium]|nr:hypothetical protein [Terriglobales bacterium]